MGFEGANYIQKMAMFGGVLLFVAIGLKLRGRTSPPSHSQRFPV